MFIIGLGFDIKRGNRGVYVQYGSRSQGEEHFRKRFSIESEGSLGMAFNKAINLLTLERRKEPYPQWVINKAWERLNEIVR